MTANICRWGTSSAIRIPAQILSAVPWYVDLSQIENGKIPVNVVLKDEKIIISPEKDITIDTLFADWNGENYDSYDWGELDMPVGKEVL